MNILILIQLFANNVHFSVPLVIWMLQIVKLVEVIEFKNLIVSVYMDILMISSITIIKNVMGLVQNAILAVAYLAMGIDCYMMKMIVLLQQTQFLMTFSQPMQEVGQRNYLLYTIIQISFKASRTT
ncbi:unnamed protein product [Paramecium octaurelia]|uniref:Uncharacterized protein n=1 Tax=Paramecium octaurelia TaxID=43137 RepID=A0A8S1ULD2_PAROT|nr:unnamed protein product [Paramecium octaurelia]